MFRVAIVLELLLYVVACGFGAYRGINELHIAVNEKEPTKFTAADFAKRHRNEQWVRVVGRAAVEFRHVQPSRHQAHQGQNVAYVMVPIVADDWKPEQPVDVFATFGPMPMFNVESWARGFPATPQAVQGQLRPGGIRDPQGTFPQLVISPNYVIINEGTEPNHVVAMAGFLVLMIFSGGLFIKRIRAALKY